MYVFLPLELYQRWEQIRDLNLGSKPLLDFSFICWLRKMAAGLKLCKDVMMLDVGVDCKDFLRLVLLK